MKGFFGTAGLFVAFLLVLAAGLGCQYWEPEVDVEDAILTPPSVQEIIDDAEELGLGPRNLLERRRRAAHEKLEELYQGRMDEARNDRAIQRLESQLGRAQARLDKHYDQRLDRLEDRLAREGG